MPRQKKIKKKMKGSGEEQGGLTGMVPSVN